MIVRGVLLLSALAASAAAQTVSFDAGPAEDAIFSADGYHVARWESSGGEDRWVLDGRVLVRGAEGSLPNAGALSADGSALLHAMAVSDEGGKRLGVAAALNGRRVGSAYPDVRSPALSPGARNAAYVARVPAGWAVVSTQGVGPAFPEPPGEISVSDKGVAYVAAWQGGRWLYVDHKPVRSLDAGKAGLSPDLRRVGVATTDRASSRSYVEVDGKRYGPFARADVPAFSRNGRHWAALVVTAESAGGVWDAVLADGRLRPAARKAASSLLVDDAGRVFQDVILIAVDDKTQVHTCFLDGTELRRGGRPPRVAMLAGGAHYAYPMMTPRGGMIGYDGRELDPGAPFPLPYTPAEFDGPGEVHYWALRGKSLLLVCASLNGGDPKRTRCAARAGARYPEVEAAD